MKKIIVLLAIIVLSASAFFTASTSLVKAQSSTLYSTSWEDPSWANLGWVNTPYNSAGNIQTSTDWARTGSRSLEMLGSILYGNTLSTTRFDNIDPFTTHYLCMWYNFPSSGSMGLGAIRDRYNRPICNLETVNTGNGVHFVYYWFDYWNDSNGWLYSAHNITTTETQTAGIHKIVMSLLYTLTSSSTASVTIGLWVDDANLGILTVPNLVYTGVGNTPNPSQVYAPEQFYAGDPKAIAIGPPGIPMTGNVYMDDLSYSTDYPGSAQPTPTPISTITPYPTVPPTLPPTMPPTATPSSTPILGGSPNPSFFCGPPTNSSPSPVSSVLPQENQTPQIIGNANLYSTVYGWGSNCMYLSQFNASESGNLTKIAVGSCTCGYLPSSFYAVAYNASGSLLGCSNLTQCPSSLQTIWVNCSVSIPFLAGKIFIGIYQPIGESLLFATDCGASGSGIFKVYFNANSTIPTSLNGLAGGSLPWMQSVYAEYTTNSTLSPTPIPIPTATPTPTPTPTPSPTPTKNVFSIDSNSTVSQVDFQSEHGLLNFTVSGQYGTFGFVNVTIAKTVLTSNSSLTAYLDNNKINFTQTESTENWYIYFTYHHSTHEISLSFNSANPKNSFSNSLIFALTSTVIIIALCFTVARNRWEERLKK